MSDGLPGWVDGYLAVKRKRWLCSFFFFLGGVFVLKRCFLLPSSKFFCSVVNVFCIARVCFFGHLLSLLIILFAEASRLVLVMFEVV